MIIQLIKLLSKKWIRIIQIEFIENLNKMA